ncbi:hypothetical protein HY643_01490 [Candidatus Woesearchaeota archaeon]|nr:hypothetical protein [Candidatus Woesearchaeota archaeon]
MGLENVFGTPEKPIEEKKLETITSEESILQDWQSYYDKTKPLAEGVSFDNIRGYLAETKNFLKSFKIKPEAISKFNEKISLKNETRAASFYFGALLSALIQTSYQQGFNNFLFNNIEANAFGYYLEGQKNKKIKITAKFIGSDYLLSGGKDCFLKAETIYGIHAVNYAERCFLNATIIHSSGAFSGTAKSYLKAHALSGMDIFWCAKRCIAEIEAYEGHFFGCSMENCKIYSASNETLTKLRNQSGAVTNTFRIKKFEGEVNNA